jgi:hypothetical protein
VWAFSGLQLHDITRKTCGHPQDEGVERKGSASIGRTIHTSCWGYVEVINPALHSLRNKNPLEFQTVTWLSTENCLFYYDDDPFLILIYYSFHSTDQTQEAVGLHSACVNNYDTETLMNRISVPRNDGAERWS